MNLAQLEALFWRAVRAECPPPELELEFVGSAALGATRRMGIYRHAYWARQERVLADTFPRVRAVTGEARFRHLVASYLKAHPSEQPAVEWVGRRFPDLLAAHAELPAYTADLARLEWARLEVLLAPPSIALRMDALQGLDLARARAELSSSARLLDLSPQALDAWRDHERAAASEKGRVLPPAAARPRGRTHGAASRDLRGEVLSCVVWRHEHRVSHRTLDATEHEALALLCAGHDFSRVCAIFADPGAAEAAARCIGRWIQDGLLCALRTRPARG
jgi:hypothetical protein